MPLFTTKNSTFPKLRYTYIPLGKHNQKISEKTKKNKKKHALATTYYYSEKDSREICVWAMY